jgi:hypothetical protein
MDFSNRPRPLGSPKYSKWRKPIRKKTAAELLEKADEGAISLTGSQRELLENRAGKAYRKRKTNPLQRKPKESVQSFLARLKEVYNKGG